MSENIHKSHNVSRLMYHFVFPTTYRRVVVDDEVEEVIKETCIEISKRYELYFLEIGTDKDHVHFLIQSVPSYSPMQIVKIVKSITAREVFARCPEVKKKLWGGNFWSSGYYVATVSEHGNEDVIANYVKNQGNVCYTLSVNAAGPYQTAPTAIYDRSGNTLVELKRNTPGLLVYDLVLPELDFGECGRKEISDIFQKGGGNYEQKSQNDSGQRISDCTH